MYNRGHTKKVLCKWHPDRKCEHFCRDHQVLLCSYCLRDKHSNCIVADEHDFKRFYGKKIKEVKTVIEAEKNELLSQTQTVLAAIDAGIARLEKHKKEVGTVIERMDDMKHEVRTHQNELNRTEHVLNEIDRQMANAHDLRTCQQCQADVELERSKFERKQRKMCTLPTRLSGDVDGYLHSLQRKLKSIRNGITSQVSNSKIGQHGNTRSYREPSKYYLPFLDLNHRTVQKRPMDHSRKDGRLSEWPISRGTRIERDVKSTTRLPLMFKPF